MRKAWRDGMQRVSEDCANRRVRMSGGSRIIENAARGGLGMAFKVYSKYWALSSITAALLFVVFVRWTGLTWLPSLFIAVIALAGYVASYRQYREQEAHKYRPALTARFELATNEARMSLQAWMPGFNFAFEGSDPVLKPNFTLENISASPVTDVRMNFYLHNYQEVRTPYSFFEHDVVVADGIAGNSRSVFDQVLRSHRIRPNEDPVMNSLAGGGRVPAFRFSQLFLSLIPSPKRDEPARLSAWSLVFKYKNLLGESFFSVYKMEGPVVREESSRMVFHGSFAGDYLVDDEDHGFVENRGFVSKEKAPDWDGVRATVEEAMRLAENFRSAMDAEAQGKGIGGSVW